MVFDSERRIHTFNAHSNLFLAKDGIAAAIYDILPGQTLRQFQEEGSLIVHESLQDHPVIDRPTRGMSIAFNSAEEQLFAPTYGDHSIEKHLLSLTKTYRYRKGRLGLTEVTGGIILGAPETAAIILMHKEKTKNRLPTDNSRNKWLFVDLFAGTPYAAGIARMGGWRPGNKLNLAPLTGSPDKDSTGAAVFVIPESAAPRLI